MDKTITHLLMLSVGVVGPDNHAQVHQDFCELSRSLADVHPVVEVSSQVLDEPADDEVESVECTQQHLVDREETLFKVRNVIYDELRSHKVVDPFDTEMLTTDLITALQNAGILFRERR